MGRTGFIPKLTLYAAGIAISTAWIPCDNNRRRLEDIIAPPVLSAPSVENISDETSEADYEIIIGLHQLSMYVLKDGKMIREFPVAVGAFETPTPPGEYFIEAKVKDPDWHIPREKIRLFREYPKGIISSGDPKNPLRHYWIELREEDKPNKNVSFGIHGTNNPNSIPDWISLGCIRMTDEGIEYVAKNIPVGSKVSIRQNLPGQEVDYINLIK